MAQKPTAQIKKAVPAIKARGLLSYNGEKDDEVIQLNTPELGLLQHLLQNKGRVNPKTGLLSFAEGGGPGSGSHDSNHGNGGGSTGGGNSAGGGPGGGPHSPGGSGGLGGIGGNAARGGSPSNDPGFSGGHATGGVGDPGTATIGRVANVAPGTPIGPAAANETPGSTVDPSSWGGLFSGLKNIAMNPTPAMRAIGVIGLGLPTPVGLVGEAALGYGTVAGEKAAQTISGIKDGSMYGSNSIGTDANGQEVGFHNGAQYGGTAGLHGGNSGEGGPSGHNIDPSQVNQFNQQNAINASTGVPGSIPGNIPSLGLLGQFQQPTQQWTVPGYGFQTPGYGWLQWGQK